MAVECPGLIIADNYPAIRSKQFQEFLAKHGIRMMFVAPNHPDTNGLVERANQTMVNRLRCKRMERQDIAWSTQVKQCVHEYNHTIHSSTGYTPAYLLTGIDDERLFEGETLQYSRMKALENSQAAHQRNAKIFNRNRRVPEFDAGEEVFVQARHQLNRGMLEPKYEGPYEVVNRIGKSTVEVMKGGKPTKYHVSQLKFRGEPVLAPRSIYQMFTVLACLSLAVPTCTSKSLHTASPLLWRSTNHMATVGYNFTTHVAMMMNPCLIFNEGLREGPSVEAIVKISQLSCEKAYKEKILRLLRNECDTSGDISALGLHSHHFTRRSRRFLVAAAFALGGVVSYGVMALEHQFSKFAVHHDLKKMDDQLKFEMDRVHAANAKSAEVERKIVERMKEQWILTKKIEENFTIEQHSSSMLSTLLETIDLTEIHLGYLLDGFQAGKVTPDYRMLFRDSPLLNFTTPVRRWTAYPCQFIGDQYFVMKFEIPVIDEKIKILQAVSFYVVTDGQNGEQCLTVFKGNQYVIWDQTFNCTRDLLWEPIREAELVLVTPEHHTCIEHVNRTSHWTKVQCSQKMFRSSIVQLKQDKDSFYVYCFQHELKVKGYDAIACGNVIYKFPRTLTFSVDGNELKVTEGEYQTRVDVSSRINAIINNRTFISDVDENQAISDLSKLIHEEEVEIERITWKRVVKDPKVYLPTAGIGSLLLITFLAYCGVKCYRKYSPAHQFRQHTNQLMALRGLMGRERR